MTDDLVQRLRRTYRKEFPVTGSMIADNSNRLRPFPILATELLFNPDGREAANRIESQAAEIERLKVQLSVETEPSPYCPICGSCGEEGCCGSKRCMYPDTGIEADREQAAAEERAKIVAWLRDAGSVSLSYGLLGRDLSAILEGVADAMEAGEHETFTRSSDT